jgi:hypothetical protein
MPKVGVERTGFLCALNAFCWVLLFFVIVYQTCLCILVVFGCWLQLLLHAFSWLCLLCRCYMVLLRRCYMNV